MGSTSDDRASTSVADLYWEQLFTEHDGESVMARVKRKNYTWRVACAVAEQRERAREAWEAVNGAEPADWPITHPPALVWAHHLIRAVCLRCDFLGRPGFEVYDAAVEAREHSGNHPLLVWSACNLAVRDDDILFVLHPDPHRAGIDAWWGVCRACGTGSVVQGMDIGRHTSHNDSCMARWAATHGCAESPDAFWLSEYGDVNRYYGLDLDAL